MALPQQFKAVDLQSIRVEAEENPKFREALVAWINKHVNIPLLSEEQEAVLFDLGIDALVSLALHLAGRLGIADIGILKRRIIAETING